MSDILNKLRKLNWMLQESPSGTLSYNNLCEILSDLMEANVYMVDYSGTMLGMSLKIPKDNKLILNEKTGQYVLPEEDIVALNNIESTTANLKYEEIIKLFKYYDGKPTKLHTLIPIVSAGERWGTLFMTRYEPEFTDEDIVLGEAGATIVALQIRHDKIEAEKREANEALKVQMAIGTLSYSETEAVQYVFSELEGDEGILVASRIADKAGITRSVIVNALRKLESASVIETRSLGMKGTRIKILNPKLKSELEKIKSH